MGGMMVGAAAWMAVWAVIAVALLVGLAAGAFAVVRRLDRGDSTPPLPSHPQPDAALQELRERYARGDIDEDELDRRLGPLLRHAPARDR